MWLKISKSYSTRKRKTTEFWMPMCWYSFHTISAKLYQDISYHGGIQAIAFVGNRLSVKSFVALWNFNMGVNGKILKCAKSWKCLIVLAKRTEIWNSQQSYELVLHKYGTFYVWFFEFSLGSLHSGALCKISDVRIFKSLYSSPSFHPISTKLYKRYGNQGGIQTAFFGNLPNFKNFMALWNFC